MQGLGIPVQIDVRGQPGRRNRPARVLQRDVEHPVHREEEHGDDEDADDGVPDAPLVARAQAPRLSLRKRRHESDLRLARRYTVANTSDTTISRLPIAAP